jgi:hypothetical protein
MSVIVKVMINESPLTLMTITNIGGESNGNGPEATGICDYQVLITKTRPFIKGKGWLSAQNVWREGTVRGWDRSQSVWKLIKKALEVCRL